MSSADWIKYLREYTWYIIIHIIVIPNSDLDRLGILFNILYNIIKYSEIITNSVLANLFTFFFMSNLLLFNIPILNCFIVSISLKKYYK